MNIGKGTLGIMVKGLLLGGLAVSATASATAMMQVKNNTPPAMLKAKMVRHHNVNAVLDIRIALPLRNVDQLNQFLVDRKDRSSPDYHKRLTAAQFTALYGPTADQVQTVVSFLTSHGIKVTGISPNNTRIHATAKTSVLENVFGVAINDYSYKGQTFYSASTDPVLPSAVAPLVMAVMGLDDAVQFQPHSIQGPTPKGAGFGQPRGFTPLQIATAYDWPDITDMANGAGVTIAIGTVYNFRPADLTKFWSSMGVPAHNVTNNNAVTVVPVDSRPTNVLNGETTLDIERSSSMAPGAKIKVYEASNPSFVSFDDEFEQIATDDDTQVVSSSWGAPENMVQLDTIGAEHESFAEMAVQNQIMIAAAGDNGASDGTDDDDHADFPTSDPLVVAAGGTSLILNPDNTIKAGGESAWGGAGGADSVIFAEPSYQVTSTITPNTSCTEDVLTAAPGAATDFPSTSADLCGAAAAPSRQTSDMSMDADPITGYALYYNGRWLEFGGTSFVAPELAGMFAILAGQNVANTSHGFVGPGPEMIYCTVANGTYSADFHDITNGNNGIFNAVAGWDHPTGWGTPDASAFIADVSTASCL